MLGLLQKLVTCTPDRDFDAEEKVERVLITLQEPKGGYLVTSSYTPISQSDTWGLSIIS